MKAFSCKKVSHFFLFNEHKLARLTGRRLNIVEITPFIIYDEMNHNLDSCLDYLYAIELEIFNFKMNF